MLTANINPPDVFYFSQLILHQNELLLYKNMQNLDARREVSRNLYMVWDNPPTLLPPQPHGHYHDTAAASRVGMYVLLLPK